MQELKIGDIVKVNGPIVAGTDRAKLLSINGDKVVIGFPYDAKPGTENTIGLDISYISPLEQ